MISHYIEGVTFGGGGTGLCHYASSEIVALGTCPSYQLTNGYTQHYYNPVVRVHAWILRLTSKRTIRQHIPLCYFQREDMGGDWIMDHSRLKTELSLLGCDPINSKAIQHN